MLRHSQLTNTSPAQPLLRRRFLQGALALGAGFAGSAGAGELSASLKALSVSQAHRLALDEQIVLVDIRRPDEWAQTGIGEGAQPLDMRRRDFLTELDRLVGGDRSRPVAIICARGVRSKWLSRQLAKAGYGHIIDVPEGMMGSRAGPGWLRAGLPVRK